MDIIFIWYGYTVSVGVVALAVLVGALMIPARKR